jgi:hypothetical protein
MNGSTMFLKISLAVRRCFRRIAKKTMTVRFSAVLRIAASGVRFRPRERLVVPPAVG